MALWDQLESQQEERDKKGTALRRAALHRFHEEPTAANFNLLFLKSYDIKPEDLKETILSLAIQGKLVPQDPKDEPLNDEQIKQLSTKPFELPDSWVWSNLENISELITSGSRGWAKYYAEDGPIFVTMGNLSRGNYNLRLEKIRHVNPPATGEGIRTKLQAHDIVISITGDVGNLGLIPENFGEAYINQHSCLLRLNKEFRNRYVAEFLRSEFAQIQFNEPQRGIKNSFRLTDVSQMPIPIPPLEEQPRIVAKVDQLMALVDQLETQLNQSQTTAENLMDALVAELSA